MLRYMYPHIDVLNSKINESAGENETIETMGRNLAA
jgi:hypothetical protein